MRTPLITSCLLAGFIALAGCSPRKAAPMPEPQVQPALPVTSGAPDPSVPSAAVVKALPSETTAKDEPSGRASDGLTRAQESSAMPMPGQVNNHSSTALDAPKSGASVAGAASAP